MSQKAPSTAASPGRHAHSSYPLPQVCRCHRHLPRQRSARRLGREGGRERERETEREREREREREGEQQIDYGKLRASSGKMTSQAAEHQLLLTCTFGTKSE